MSMPGAGLLSADLSGYGGAPALVDRIMAVIRKQESGGNYQALNGSEAATVAASGAYQYIRSTWQSWARRAGVDTNLYPRAIDAPPEVQDAVARLNVQSILDANGNNPDAVWATWYTGQYDPNHLDYTPSGANSVTVRQYINSANNILNSGGGAPDASGAMNTSYTAPGAASPTQAGSNAANTGAVDAYGWMRSIVNDPEVNGILDQASLENWAPDKLKAELAGTQWWMKTAPSIRNWDALKGTDPAGAQQQIGQTAGNIFRMGGALGINLTQEQSANLAEQALRLGWSSDEVRNAIIGEAQLQPGQAPEGTIGMSQAQVKAVAAKYLIPVSDAQAQDFAVRIAKGELDQSGIEVHFQNLAKSRFPWLSQQLDAGFTPADIFDSQKQAIAKTLEIDPETVDFANDPKWWPVLQTPAKDGSFRSMTISEAQRWASSQDEFKYTAQARQSAYELGGMFEESFGMRK